MGDIFKFLINAKKNQKKLLAVLLDPDKIQIENFDQSILKLKKAPIDLILIGGSNGNMTNTSLIITQIKKNIEIPVLLFPGHPSHLVNNMDALLLNVLISGDNPDFLIKHHIASAPYINEHQIEVISNGYVLIDGGNVSTTQKVTNTKPISSSEFEKIFYTALTAKYLGYKTIYLEAGSGAGYHVPLEVIERIKEKVNLPLFVGGGIKSLEEIHNIHQAGADIVVIGTAFENNSDFFND